VKILIAPDKFKGSLSAKQACEGIQTALLECDPSLIIKKIPLADGGEGTCTLLTDFTGGSMVAVEVRDPLFRNIISGYGIAKDGKTAFIEMATASGLQLLAVEERNPLFTTTLGTGDLIRHAMERGVSDIILGIGGSATNDGGLGVGEALGLKFFSLSKQKLKPVGENLNHVAIIDFGKLHPRCREVNCVILCDVDNPLYGPRGAALVYAPQKGADANSVKTLDNGLKHFGKLLQRTFDSEIDFPGAGAAGGVSIMLKALLKTEVRSGMEFISAFTDLEKEVAQSDIIITGEGRMDEQTLSGKVVFGVARLGKKYKKTLLAVTGKCDLDANQLNRLGVHHYIQLADNETSEREAIENALTVLKIKVKQQLFPLLKGLKK